MRMFQDEITNVDQLRDVVGFPGERVQRKVITSLDQHCRDLISLSPYVVLATTDGEGRMDVSPKGDPPGFVRVLDDTTLAIPDRPGNKRADGFLNILENPRVGLLFLVPGYRETLRIGGSARIVRDETLRRVMAVGGRTPDLALVVDVEEAFFHCGKCAIRSALWEPQRWPDVTRMPAYGQITVDQTRWHEPVETVQEQLRESYRERLY
ncbi:MAG: pyridoxamine 5'-phosphate oxidase family protein [Acidobacteriota bacterium]|nr:pyridoxamine 5'-phosphate oxidase family protein [Acidobacteriota bacterium]